MNPKYLTLQPSKQKIECWIRVIVYDGTERTYCTSMYLNESINVFFVWFMLFCYVHTGHNYYLDIIQFPVSIAHVNFWVLIILFGVCNDSLEMSASQTTGPPSCQLNPNRVTFTHKLHSHVPSSLCILKLWSLKGNPRSHCREIYPINKIY